MNRAWTTMLAGPIVLIRPGDRLPPGGLTVSHCLGDIAPDAWAIDWVRMEPADRGADAARCGISLSQLADAVAWATESFDRTFAWPHMFLDLAAAQEFRRRFLPDTFRVLQIALPGALVDSFLNLAAPPPQQPGYAPEGATASYQAVSKQVREPLVGERRGFEILGYERYGGGFESYRCFELTKDFIDLGASFNQWGLIADEEQALRCAEFADRSGNRACADAWHPWLIVEHAS